MAPTGFQVPCRGLGLHCRCLPVAGPLPCSAPIGPGVVRFSLKGTPWRVSGCSAVGPGSSARPRIRSLPDCPGQPCANIAIAHRIGVQVRWIAAALQGLVAAADAVQALPDAASAANVPAACERL
jgi:hypothetical protein